MVQQGLYNRVKLVTKRVFFMYIKSLHDVIKNYDHFIVDVWGVVHNGHTLFPHVLDTLQEIQDLKKEVIFLSNAPRRAHQLAEDLAHFGVTADLYRTLHTSGEDAYEFLHQKKSNHYKNLTPYCYAFMTNAGHGDMMRDCQLVRVGELNEASFLLNLQPPIDGSLKSEDYERLLNEALDLNLPMVCVNPDLGVVLGDKVHQCAGTLAQYYEKLGGVVHYHGKPFPSVYQSVLKKFSVQDKKRTLAIGDSLRTDIQGANNFGVDSLLVLSGLDSHHSTAKTPEDKAALFLSNTDLKPTYVCSELR